MTKASKQIGVGLIGYGLGGRVFHAPFIQATDGLALRAVVSRDPAKVHSDLPDMTVFPSAEEVVAQTDIDLVVVSSPDSLHAEHAIAALRTGKHVVVDKPFATNLADARRIAETADLAGRMVTVFHNRRWDADFLTLQRLIAEGRLGRIVHFESHFDRWRPEPGGVWKEAREGGSWLDLGPHLVDQALCLFGKPEAVTADIATMRHGAPAPDWFHAILHYPRMRAILHSSKLSADHRLRFSVYGTSGSWVKQGFDTQESAVLAGSAPGHRDLGCDPELGMFTQAGNRELPIANERGDYGLFWRRLVGALQENEPNPVPVDEALLVMEVLQAGLESAVSGSTVRL